MVGLTTTARNKLQSLLGDNRPTIRVQLIVGGCGMCGGNILGMITDEPTEKDLIFEDKSFTFCIDKELMDDLVNVTIDFIEPEFQVMPQQGKGLCKCVSSGM